MNVIRRHEKIMELLLAKREIEVVELTKLLAVTGKTIREDLAKLEQKGLLQRVHGGAVLSQENQLGMLLPKQHVPQGLERQQIADLALSLIQPNEIIALDGGRTTLELAKRLPDVPLTIVTNDLHIVAELARREQIRLVVPGGYQIRNMLVGPEAAAYIRKLNISKAFLSTTGVHPTYGFTIYSSDSSDIKRAWLETASVSYVMADHSKFEQGALFTFAKLHEVEGILTDSGLPSHIQQAFAHIETQIITA